MSDSFWRCATYRYTEASGSPKRFFFSQSGTLKRGMINSFHEFSLIPPKNEGDNGFDEVSLIQRGLPLLELHMAPVHFFDLSSNDDIYNKFEPIYVVGMGHFNGKQISHRAPGQNYIYGIDHIIENGGTRQKIRYGLEFPLNTFSCIAPNEFPVQDGIRLSMTLSEFILSTCCKSMEDRANFQNQQYERHCFNMRVVFLKIAEILFL